jgi:hypothetical protein
VRGGAADVTLDATRLKLEALSVSGGASELEVQLPGAHGHVQICIEGGLNRVAIQHPEETPVELRVHGGANRLVFGARRFGAIGGDLRLATPGWEEATDRYAIEARGGASRLVIQEN